ncbi:MAG: pilus assembly protein [Planctomycetes bacterium]|nr:pilus assembly protein [Planctomycetota bacterium]
MKSQVSEEQGSATVEFCITLPMYLFIFYGVLFFGQATFVDQEMNLARAYATFNLGQDSDGQLNLNVLSSFVGSLNVEAIGRKSLPVVPTQDVDQNGQDDKWVDQTRIRLTSSGLREEWLEGSGWTDVTDQFPSSTGPFSNFNQPLSGGSAPTANALWMNSSQTILKYTYSPSFVRFIYGEQPLTTAQYLTYDLEGSLPAQNCRDCHSSLVPQTNQRLTASSYRGRQQRQGLLPVSGSEDYLWSHLRVMDMLQLITANGKTPVPDTDAMPPADQIDAASAAGQLLRPDRWDPSYVLNYETDGNPW